MKRAIRKTTASVSVTYKSGDYSNSLMGADFVLEDIEGGFCLSIDLSANLRVRNKAANCYEDGQALIDQNAYLQTLQINEAQVRNALTAVHRKAPKGRWQIRLFLGQNEIFIHEATLEELDGSVCFNFTRV